MDQASIWIIYLIVLVVAALLLFYYWRMPLSLAIFLASVVGAIFFAIISPGVVMYTDDERTWFGFLSLLVVIIPLASGFWYLTMDNGMNLGCEVENLYFCDDQVCRLSGQRRRCGNTSSTLRYNPNSMSAINI